MKYSSLLIAFALILGITAEAQIPKSKETGHYEYKEELSVKRAGSSDIFHRIYYWGKEEFKGLDYEIERDDTTFQTIIFHVTEPLVESHFGVNRTHKDRVLKYDLIVNSDKKNYTYRINNIYYSTLEVGRKGEQEELEGQVENLKSPAMKSVEEEIDMKMQDVIKSLKSAAEKEMTDAQEEEADAWEDEMDEAWDKRKEERERRQEEAEEAREAAEEAAEEAREAAEKAAEEAKKAAEEAEKEEDK